MFEVGLRGRRSPVARFVDGTLVEVDRASPLWVGAIFARYDSFGCRASSGR